LSTPRLNQRPTKQVQVSGNRGTSEADPLWSHPCLAYNLHAALDESCRKGLAAIQERLHRVDCGTLACAPLSLHVSVASLLSVRKDYGLPKDELWARCGDAWCASLQELASRTAPFVVRFYKVLVSNSAVIAMAEPVKAVDNFRQRAAQLLGQQGLDGAQPSILHCSLLRFATSGLDLSRLSDDADTVDPGVSTVVTRLVVLRELVYPNLVTETLKHFRVGAY
jgi:hypothetical protein